MKNQDIRINDDALNELGKTDASIQHWSNKYVKDTLALRALESTISTLYSRRQKIITEILKNNNIDVSKVKDAQIFLAEDKSARIAISYIEESD
jgi:hypothetical protein